MPHPLPRLAPAVGMSAFALGLPLGAPAAQTPPVPPRSAPIADVRYDVTFDSAHAAARRVGVRMTFTARGPGPVLLALPAWTPGAYELNYYARQVADFAATGPGGRPLAWDKVDHQTWRVVPESSGPNGAGPVTVSFEVRADQLENAKSWASADFLFFTGTNLFLYPAGQPLDRYPAAVRVHAAPGWRVATGMTPVAPTAGSAPNEWYEASYHDLVDMPFFVGRFDLDSARVSGRWTRLATYPAGRVSAERRRRALDGLARVIPPEVAVFGEAPWRTYTVLQATPDAAPGAGGSYGALEHQNSTLAVMPPSFADSTLDGLYAHEVFHAWNVKRLRPADLVPYRYAREQPTPLLWVSEGLTGYYADVAQLRGGVTDSAAFLAAIANNVATVRAAPRTAPEDASRSTWVKPTDGSNDLYYPEGALAGFLLDILIRDESDNRGSLDTVMRDLYERTYKARLRGFTTAEFFDACVRAAGADRTAMRRAGTGRTGGPDFGEFYRRYVHGREPLPFDRVLALAGLRLQADTVRETRVGVATRIDSSKTDSSGAVLVTGVAPGGVADAAGVRAGDRLLAVGDVAVRDARWAEAYRRRYAGRPGADLPIRVRRGSETLTLAGRVVVLPRPAVRIVPDGAAPERARRVRAGIFHGASA